MTSSVRKIKEKERLDLSKYMNTETGEPLSSELQGKSIQLTTQGSSVMICSDNYVIIDADSFNFLKKHLNRSELGSIGIMSVDLKTELNVIYNNNFPHTNDSLQKVLGIASNSTFHVLIKKLVNLGVVYQMKGKVRDRIMTFYLMNPFLARKRKTIDAGLAEIFTTFKENKL